MTIVIGRNSRGLPPRGNASCAPKMRIGITGRERLGNDQAETGLRWLEIAVQRPGALREDDGTLAGADEFDHRLDRRHVRTLLIHRDDVELRKERPEKRPLK